jgi:hypothetical protein
VLPQEDWRAMRLKPEREVEFTLADGTAITRGVSECRFEIRGESATSPVVLGEAGDGALLGAVTLETLGFMLNPLTREILPMRMALSHVRRCGLMMRMVGITALNPSYESAECEKFDSARIASPLTRGLRGKRRQSYGLAA